MYDASVVFHRSIMTGMQYIYAAQKGLARSEQSIKALRVRIRLEVRTAACAFERYTTHFLREEDIFQVHVVNCFL